MGDADSFYCCCFCGSGGFSTLFSVVIVVWLGLWTLKPSLTVDQFDVKTSTATTANETAATTIFFDLNIKNRNFNKRVYYDAINVTFYHKSSGKEVQIGEKTFPAFTQGLWKRTQLSNNFTPADGAGVEAASAGVFRVDLATAVKYTKMYFWKSKKKDLKVSADVDVNDKGNLANKDGVKLRSSAGGKRQPGFVLPAMVAVAASWVLLVRRSLWVV